MKRVLLILLVASLGAVLALLWTFLPQPLPMPQPSTVTLPSATPPAGMSISVLHTGSIDSRAALAFRGGAFGERREFAMAAVLVRHPRGDLLIDAGFGRDVHAHVARTPWLARSLTRYTSGTPAGAQLRAQGIEPRDLRGVLLTHAHWDHVSGLDSLEGAPVWITAAERGFIQQGGPQTELMRSFAGAELTTYGFEQGPYLGFPQSFDVWGDGALVVVPTPGHTPGSVVVFITLPSGARYALLGDLVWQLDGITEPAERPWLARRMLGEDERRVREQIAHFAAIHQRFPQIQLIPAHDARALAALPTFPAAAQ